MSPAFGRDEKRTDADEMMDRMQMAGLPASAAAQMVADKVVQVLEQRIATILDEDPQAKTCLDILRAIDAASITAREAARRYVRRYNFLIPALASETTPEKAS